MSPQKKSGPRAAGRGAAVRRATATGRSKNVVEVTNLNVSFRTATGVIKVVENVSFSVTKGECLAVVGESGSGKSVSALATIGLLSKGQAIVEGSVKFLGEQLLGKPESYMRKIRGGGISMIFQEPLSALNPVTTIGEQIAEEIGRAHV